MNEHERKSEVKRHNHLNFMAIRKAHFIGTDVDRLRINWVDTIGM